MLYRLIEAGQLARHALLVPLAARGLEPGDDAVLFLLRGRLGASEPEVAAALGMPPGALGDRLRRLAARGLIERRGIGPSLLPGLLLTDEGERVRTLLTEHWDGLEEALLCELPPKRRKHLRRGLERVVELLKP